MTITPNDDLLSFLRHHLLEEIIPFWERVGPAQTGGFNTCVDSMGELRSTEKFLWGQWRSVWVFARLYNSIEKKQKWLDIAEATAAFALEHGWDAENGGWSSRIAEDGKIIEGFTSIYAGGFALYGLGELYRATGKQHYLDWIKKTLESIEATLALPHDQIPHQPYPVPQGMRVHGIPLIFSIKYIDLGVILKDDFLKKRAGELQDEIFSGFYRSEYDLIVERVLADGQMAPAPAGTAIVPGHVLESLWFQIHVAEVLGREDKIKESVRLIKRHLEFGWDVEYGGIFLGRDARGGLDADWHYPFPQLKRWWPQTEALYAALLAGRYTSEPWAMEWYYKLLNHCMKYYYMPEVGEWWQDLDRDNTRYEGKTVYPVKDPFHLPRSLIMQIELLEGRTELSGF